MNYEGRNIRDIKKAISESRIQALIDSNNRRPGWYCEIFLKDIEISTYFSHEQKKKP